MKYTIIFVLLLTLLACHSVKINTLSPELPKVSYTGKGTQAGPMLMGAMGPMGIAVGIAIDEGISKDIKAQIKQHQPMWLAKTQAALNTYFSSHQLYTVSDIKLVAAQDNDFAVASITVSSAQASQCYSTASVALEGLKTQDVFWPALLKSIETQRLCDIKTSQKEN